MSILEAIENKLGVEKSATTKRVDINSKLDAMSAGSGLNWKQSIVDLLKVLDMDSSFAARKELAKELACPADLMGDSAKMNVWLHEAVLQKFAKGGDEIPQGLL